MKNKIKEQLRDFSDFMFDPDNPLNIPVWLVIASVALGLAFALIEVL